MKEVNFVSLGAGVQSSTLALRFKELTGKKCDGYIFADTGFEPKKVYQYLTWLECKLDPCDDGLFHRCSAPKDGDLKGNILKHTLAAIKGKTRSYSGVPAYMEKGFIRRQCTSQFKILVIHKKIRELCGVKPRQKFPKNKIKVNLYIGISTDEVTRMKPSRVPWIEHKFPLIDHRISRSDCLRWFKEQKLPTPAKSACIFCAYHSNSVWLDMKKNSPKEFAMAVKIDKKLRQSKSTKYPFDVKLYLHPSKKPLDEVDFEKKNKNQPDLFENNCVEGMCGV